MTIRIVIADDNMFIRRTLSKIVEEKGWTVVGEAANGQEAINQYAEHKPDIVVMDITMPVLDGIAAVEQIVAGHPGARIIMCSAVGQQDMLVKAVKAGAKDFISKPFQKDRVVAAIEGVLAK